MNVKVILYLLCFVWIILANPDNIEYQVIPKSHDICGSPSGLCIFQGGDPLSILIKFSPDSIFITFSALVSDSSVKFFRRKTPKDSILINSLMNTLALLPHGVFADDKFRDCGMTILKNDTMDFECKCCFSLLNGAQRNAFVKINNLMDSLTVGMKTRADNIYKNIFKLDLDKAKKTSKVH